MDFIEKNYPELEPIIKIVRSSGVTKLYEHQRNGLKYALKGSNVLMATPTSSGKTLVAELSMMHTVLNGKKVIYLVPLKSLANEKFRDFQKYSKFARIAMSVGDLDSKDLWLKGFDIIICSYEKLDSLLRHKSEWLKDVGLVIIDEIHMIDSPSRGPTLEILITRLRTEVHPQIIALSATVKNASDVGKWLDAKVIKSDFRPVKLFEGVAYDGFLEFPKEDKKIPIDGNPFEFVVKDTIRKNKQAIVFVSTRRSAEHVALQISEMMDSNSKLDEISEKILHVLPNPTDQCRKLAKVVKRGVAFDHAGLVLQQKNIIEDAFREGLIKFIISTPVLSYGVSLPAFRVIIRDTKRFSESFGMNYISKMDYMQMAGRAGRLGKEDYGESIIIAKESEKDKLVDMYIYGDMEEIYSKLAVEPVLRMHTLSLISSELTRDFTSLENFFSKTFFYHQYGDKQAIHSKLVKIISLLKERKFIKTESSNQRFTRALDLMKNSQLIPTRVGKRISELYIDPESAWKMIQSSPRNEIDVLMTINSCVEMRPFLRIKKNDDIEEMLDKFDIEHPDVWDIEYDDFLKKFKTTMMFLDWMNEMSEERITSKYSIRPGDLYTKLLSADWMLYSFVEIAKTLRKKEIANIVNKTRMRVKYGVREELLPLVKIKWIGRAKARRLFIKGIKNMGDIMKNQDDARKILGGKTYEKIIKERMKNIDVNKGSVV